VSRSGPALAAALISAASAYAQCPAEWQPVFNMPGVYARSLLAHDDGTGEALYAGGTADARCPVSKWDGVQWSGAGYCGDDDRAYQVRPLAPAGNRDGAVNVFDTDPFVQILGCPEAQPAGGEV
jgi:hypothetical protein